MMGDIEDLILLFGVSAMLQPKSWSAREHLIIQLIWATIFTGFLALSIQ